MNKDGILSDDKMAKMGSVQPNGQLVDIIIIDSQSDENKICVETSIRDSSLKEHKEPPCTTMDNNANEETSITDDDSEADSYEFSLRESDNEQASASEEGTEVPLTEEEVEELVAEFLEVESKAAQAQESLEKESLDKIETEVRLELSERLQGDELESAVSTEMEQFQMQWENELDDLEIRSSILLEQLDAAGIELPRLYKSIESQVPNVCETEAWKSRTHWAGSQVPEEANRSIKNADEYLQSCRPVRRKHGRLLEEGASGFLAGKVPVGDDDSVKCDEKSWSFFNELIKSKENAENTFGSSNWASVYLASTPQEAAALGLQFPGVDEVEEISEVDGVFDDIKGVDEVELSEEQRRKYRKVTEEDDAKIMKCLQRRSKGKRTRGSCKENIGLVSSCDEKPLPENGVLGAKSDLPSSKKLKTDENKVSIETLKHTFEDDENEKRLKTVIIESDDDMQIDNKRALQKDGEGSSAEVEKVVDIIDLDLFPSQSPKLPTKSLPKTFKCTICSEMLNASDVHRHPVLDVVVCGSCRFLVIEKNRLEDPVSGGYCTWCAQSELLQSCSSCKLLFCTNCLSKNLGEECLSEAKATGWQCCCCIPSQLELLISECDKALSGVESSDSESSNTELSGPENNGPVSKRRMKKSIRRIMDDTELGEETKRKIAMEKARQDHLKSMQEQSATKLRSENVGTPFEAPVEICLQDAGDGHIVNLAREEDEEPVRIPSSMSSKLKPHQVEGIRFMWENVIQSVKKVKSGDKGLGCILAHNMGLGKTFQVITFLYTVMRCAQLGLRTALVVTPVNVLHNWRKEFSKWRPSELKPLRVFMLEDVARVKRPDLLTKWRVKGGVLLIGYSSFRNLSLGKHVKDKNSANEIAYALQCGPDILVCDEAHMIKNRRADITQALKQVRTQRRIALTGSPLQNNLMEYYCMVDFVREGFLGSTHEFRNRFQNPIENGQHMNSTSDDVKIMNQRSHILFEQLKGFVQRKSMNVVKNDLPPKKVFVITVKLSQLQRKLYKRFLDVHGFSSSGYSEKSHSSFFAKYQTLAQAAARVIRIGSRTDFMLGDILHPAINWADKESHVDPDEMAKIKSAFVGNLPEDVNEEYLRKLFEQFGEVVRVAISRKGQGPVGFVHFANRSELENAIEEMDGKTVRGPNRGPSFRIQVSVARPVADNDKKRSREEVRTRRSNVSGDRQDYSHGRYGHDSLDRQVKAPRLSNYVADASDPYESAVNSLPSAAKEVLLRILRLGIGTRYDIDIHCVKSLNELPESSALAVLNQFLISGGDKRNKGDYFASLIAKHQAEAFGLTHTLHSTAYLPRNSEIHSKRYPDEDYDFVTPGSSRYSSSGHHPSTYYIDDPPVSQSRIRRYAEERSTIVRNPEPRPRHDEIDIRMNPEPRLAYESRHNTGKHLDRRYIQEHSSNIERSAEEPDLSRERRFLPAAGYNKAGYNTDLGSDFRSRSPAEYSAERQQVRFDPFTGEPYKFDPFTGEPIRPDPNPRRSGSLY